MASLSPRPLLATRADSDLYLPRRGLDDPLRRGVDRGRNTLVVGDHGSGRTSLLHALERELRARNRSVVYVDARALHGTAEIVRAVGTAVEDEGHPPGLSGSASTDPDQPVAAALRALPGARGVVVLLDDPAPQHAFELFGRHRDRVWETEYTWAVATTPSGAGVLVAPPADAFFERRIDVTRLSPTERRDVLYRRAPELDSTVVQILMEHGPENLRELIAAAGSLLDGDVDPVVYATGLENRRRRAMALGYSALIAFDEVAALEPVSASDERLLARLRWTKARASKVLNALVEAGLLKAERAEADGPGRPRKLYVTRPPEYFA